MDKFIINGPCKVKGQIKVSGSKNAALPILAATLLFDEPVELSNVPNVRDIRTMYDLLRSLNKKIIVSIKKGDLAISSADARPEVFSPGNALDAKITDLDLEKRKIKLSVKAAQIDEEKSLVAKFGEGATKSGATLKGIFEKALGRKSSKKKDK